MKRSTLSPARRAQLGMTAALAAAIMLGGALALFNAHSARANVVRAEDQPRAAVPAPQSSQEEPGTDVSGTVVETLAVSNYTYLRLSTDTGEVWAAVPSAQVATGSQVTIANAMRMDDFKSSTLGRTFEEIYFGTLAAPAPRSAGHLFSPADILDEDEPQLPPGHPEIGTAAAPGRANENGSMPPGHPPVNSASPHSGLVPTAAALPELSAQPIAAALGTNAHVIAELTARRHELAGKKIRVRGQVTKVTPNVQGRTFFHIRDGKPGAPGEQTDLVVTSTLEPSRGQVSTFEGTLRADVDIGTGYSYPTLLEDAAVVAE